MNGSNRVVGYVLTATVLLACPCHLPFTLPLALGLLGGTAFGAALGTNTWLVAALAAGLYLLNRRMDEESGLLPETRLPSVEQRGRKK